jgi:hypothetical protein
MESNTPRPIIPARAHTIHMFTQPPGHGGFQANSLCFLADAGSRTSSAETSADVSAAIDAEVQQKHRLGCENGVDDGVHLSIPRVVRDVPDYQGRCRKGLGSHGRGAAFERLRRDRRSLLRAGDGERPPGGSLPAGCVVGRSSRAGASAQAGGEGRPAAGRWGLHLLPAADAHRSRETGDGEVDVSSAAAAAQPLDIYQHDSAAMLQFVLRGNLAGAPVKYMEHSWRTARSTLGTRRLVVDVAGLTGADSEGMELLSRMRESGARLTAAQPPVSPELTRSLGVPAGAHGRRQHRGTGIMAVIACAARALFAGTATRRHRHRA